jgi:pimeloyl-ACP methyl ester carboxylesterase
MNHRLLGCASMVFLACGGEAAVPRSAATNGGEPARETIAASQGPIEERVSFRNGDVTLGGVLIQPRTAPPHPAIVFVHGDGPMRHDSKLYPPLWSAFAADGFACLIWDKPGVGHSDGDWLSQTMEDRAEEVRAAMRYLRARGDIDGRRIGLWGISQAGWVMPLLTAGSTDVAFMISVSGPNSFVDQGRYIYEASIRAAKSFSETDVQKGLTFYGQLLDLWRHGESFDAYRELVKRHDGEAWMQTPMLKQLLGDTSAERWAFLLKNFRSDARPALEKTTIPVLAVFGELDRNVPPRESADMYRQALATAANPDVTIRFVPEADHTIRKGEIYAPGYITMMSDWLRRHGQAK